MSSGEGVRLIAAEPPRQRILETLTSEGFTARCFDTVESMKSKHQLGDLSPIALWIEETTASIAGQIEPLRNGFEHTPIVVLCASIERWELRAALAAGAAGVVTDEEMEQGLGPCLRAVQVGQVCVPRGHWRQVEPPALSAREKQVLSLVVMGHMNCEIAERLFLSESTVKSHLSSAFGKLGVRSRNEAADLITNPERGLGIGILELDPQSPETQPASAS
jgi:DNA-binding CsgD family transcriptional regulator